MEARSAECRVCLSEQPRLLSTESDAGRPCSPLSHLEVIGVTGGRGCAVTEPLPGKMGQRAGGERQRRPRHSLGCCDSNVRPQLERDDPLNLSISISGGKETNQDSLSNGERSGNSSGCQSPAERSANCGLETPAVLARFPGPKLTWNGASERVTIP